MVMMIIIIIIIIIIMIIIIKKVPGQWHVVRRSNCYYKQKTKNGRCCVLESKETRKPVILHLLWERGYVVIRILLDSIFSILPVLTVWHQVQTNLTGTFLS
jgi:competence protein ComGC